MTASRPRARQTVRFCRSADGTRLAYATYGEGPPLIVSTCWLSHLEHDLDSPVWRHFVEDIGRVATLVRYDERGFGLSDWDVPDFDFTSRVQDLEAVADATGFERFALLGMSQGGPTAVAYTVRHPERVSRLMLHGSYTATVDPTQGAALAQFEDAFTRMIEVGWARPEGRFRRVFTDMLMPGASPEQMTWVDDLMRLSTSTENAIAFRHARMSVDVSHLLPEVDVPTLVVHARGDQMNPVSGSRRLAAEIPGARLVTLESDNHVLLADEPAWAIFLTELDDFLEPDRAGATVVGERSGGSDGSGAGDAGRSLDLLTAREREVLALVADGRDNREIAEELVLSVRTVERHLQTVYRKLDLTGSAQRTAAAALLRAPSGYASAASGGS